MKEKNSTAGKTGIMEETLESLTVRREAPRSVLPTLLILYLVTSGVISVVAGSDKIVLIGDYAVEVYTFAGVLSSLANILIILIAVFCGRKGFISSVIVICIQIPILILGIVVKHRLTSLPGLFGYLLTIVGIIVIYVSNKKVEKYQLRLREQATTDTLTGLPNWFACSELVNELIRHNRPFVSVSIDINGFKGINDTMGFDIGNKVLVTIASRWKEIADKGLSGTRDFVTRLSGDEFALVIRGYKTDEDIVNSISKYEEALSDKMSIDGYDFSITASFGYAEFPRDADKMDSLLSYADAAMNEIKRINSGEHIMRFTPEHLKSQNLLILDRKVRDAIDEDLIFVNLQPQFDMSHKLHGFEALARMKDTEGNFISPADFIPAAERMGLIDRLDHVVYEKASMFFGDLLKRSGSDIILSINVSVKHLMKSDFIDEIRGILEKSGIPAGQLEIEITESIMIESIERTSAYLNELKEMGIRLAIDDFGTGYSSLSYLNSFPADMLKVDKSFIDIMNTSDSSKQYVEAIISLGHIMGFSVIAEGVEEETQLETLRSIDCDYVQGFIWGRPLPMEEAEKLVLN